MNDPGGTERRQDMEFALAIREDIGAIKLQLQTLAVTIERMERSLRDRHEHAEATLLDQETRLRALEKAQNEAAGARRATMALAGVIGGAVGTGGAAVVNLLGG